MKHHDTLLPNTHTQQCALIKHNDSHRVCIKAPQRGAIGPTHTRCIVSPHCIQRIGGMVLFQKELTVARRFILWEHMNTVSLWEHMHIHVRTYLTSPAFLRGVLGKLSVHHRSASRNQEGFSTQACVGYLTTGMPVPKRIQVSRCPRNDKRSTHSVVPSPCEKLGSPFWRFTGYGLFNNKVEWCVY
jgi:hypothetical protein